MSLSLSLSRQAPAGFRDGAARRWSGSVQYRPASILLAAICSEYRLADRDFWSHYRLERASGRATGIGETEPGTRNRCPC